ncbi:uncharacterized protein C18orf19 homolog A [Drosophila mojavensis]|uniref:uncharacterized protein C18orf19 homolog A n=1 Tax=Drosophila mojavensis TaxID=7230 RepID=UPI001CD15301|nr:uncharacterized protein C18orf19 homolog A [Drosophila mojavensis]
MVTVGLLSSLLCGRGVGSGVVCILARIASPRVNLNLNPRCLSFLGSINKGNGRSSASSLSSSTLPSTTTTATTILSPLLVARYRSYARLSTKSNSHCANANKTDTKSSSTATTTTSTSNSTSTSTTTTNVSNSNELFGEAANMGLFAKFKHMYKQYWYVLIPVHVITSIGWFGGFYYLSKSGVDVPAVLQYLHLSENIIEKVQGSDMGHYAIAYLCYKVATPVRYALTLGGTTLSIKYLVQWGHIKPMPTKSQLIKMYEDTKATRASAKASKDENRK